MCYSSGMERIGVRELRNQASRTVRRARAGERLIITVDGVPAAEIGPVQSMTEAVSLEGLIASGALLPAQDRTPPPPARPLPAPTGRPSSAVLRRLRDR